MAGAPTFSLIVPAYNEERLLPRLLDSVAAARRRYSRGPSAVEVIVADNASTDTTAAVASARGVIVVPVAKRAIAAARNGGAAAASGEILAFVDADSIVHENTFDAVERAMATGRWIAGATGVRLERMSLGLAVTWAILVPMAAAMRMDTGVVFCRREDFAAVGGYDERRLFAEDVQFLWDLRRRGKADGRRLLRLGGVKAVTSTRKFDKYGEWHYLTQILRLGLLMLRSRTAMTDFARRYWYEDR